MGKRQSKLKSEGLKQLPSSELDMLISRITKQNCHSEADTGAPVGRERVVFQK